MPSGPGISTAWCSALLEEGLPPALSSSERKETGVQDAAMVRGLWPSESVRLGSAPCERNQVRRVGLRRTNLGWGFCF